MKLLLPKQHGAWSMLLIPFLLGLMLGTPTWWHVPLFIGWLFLYLVTYPLLMIIKNAKNMSVYIKWVWIYSTPSIVFLLLVLAYNHSMFYFGISMLPFFLINIYFSKMNRERALVNDISAIVVFGIGGLASYYLGEGNLDMKALLLFAFSVAFFIGSTFYVKTMIREKKNQPYKWISWIYHTGLIIAILFIGSPYVVIAFLPSLIRAVYFYGKKLSVKRLGILEIVNALYFFIALLVLL